MVDCRGVLKSTGGRDRVGVLGVFGADWGFGPSSCSGSTLCERRSASVSSRSFSIVQYCWTYRSWSFFCFRSEALSTFCLVWARSWRSRVRLVTKSSVIRRGVLGLPTPLEGSVVQWFRGGDNKSRRQVSRVYSFVTRKPLSV